jgi:hypothetical protein
LKPSIIFYKLLNQLLDKWQLLSNTHDPSTLDLSIKADAFLPCPCPSDIVYKLTFLARQ